MDLVLSIAQRHIVVEVTDFDLFAAGVREPDCLVWSILSCIFCNCITGIIAIVFSVMARESFDRGWYIQELHLTVLEIKLVCLIESICNTGDVNDGRSKARVAKILNIVGLVTGLIWIIIVVVYYAVVAAAVTRAVTSCYYYTDNIGSYYYSNSYC